MGSDLCFFGDILGCTLQNRPLLGSKLQGAGPNHLVQVPLQVARHSLADFFSSVGTISYDFEMKNKLTI